MKLGLTKNSWLFAIKTTIAAMLALYISLAFDLTNPSWAVATVFIASQPFSSSTFSKGLYRIIGTFCGALVALFLVPNLVQTPIILCLAFSLWVALCLYVSLQDRSPRSYMFMLAGYTATIIGFPSVMAPDVIFTTATDRFQEILLGVVSSALVHSVLFPNNIFNAVKATIDKWINDAYQLIGMSLNGRENNPEGKGYDLLHNVANYPMNLERLADHLVYDGRRGRQQAAVVENIQSSMRQIVPLVDSIFLRINLLGEENIPQELKDIFNKLKKSSEIELNQNEFHQIKTELNALKKQYSNLQTTQFNISIYALIIRLIELTHFMHKVQILHENLSNDQYKSNEKAPKKHYFVDQKLALLSALTVFCTIMVTCLLWIFCGWDSTASSMPMMAAISCSLFATFDSALPPLKMFINATVVSILIVLFYAVMVLPSINSYEMLLLVIVPLFMALALFMTVPNTAFISMILAINLASLMGLKNEYHSDFLFTINSGLTTVLGIGIAFFMIYAMRSKKPIWVASQIEKYALRDIINTIKRDISAKKYWKERESFINRMLDKTYQLLPRVKHPTKKKLYEDTHLLNDIRLGINLLDLKQYLLQSKNQTQKVQVQQLLDNIIDYLELKLAHKNSMPREQIFRYIDELMSQYQGTIAENELNIVLYNIKISLHPDYIFTTVKNDFDQEDDFNSQLSPT
ncbi:FUSC family protein [Acinetobacter gerneri]|uniref:FUSC family protein n=1 Tax=Acinetobacter gerneri TaxID=202952 RepID=A0AAW8JI54_9GAMM|nr:FUSC family protein [Acinetobacter gerneri]MDQ9010813.1 FUSC family protein [Acinetobacter gerneri]MDQ9014949.1 FUSC family protein [Acinetobacter gerneri]MDQ9026118.1 FUSC family protein [Acinetobacter gerneri]MDQ9053399.1 FUSC family protein [Acinetobacter gerneri]MDQ9061020.1 FUSC family protein [Acinetobacter gerneri]